VRDPEAEVHGPLNGIPTRRFGICLGFLDPAPDGLQDSSQVSPSAGAAASSP
jgi:hypothetical protein